MVVAVKRSDLAENAYGAVRGAAKKARERDRVPGGDQHYRPPEPLARL
jgi:hypothetical protein